MQNTERGQESMNERIEITKEMLGKARDYVPLDEKETWVSRIAEKCFSRLQITHGDEPLPPMYMVNVGLKNRYMMAALAKMYFGVRYAQDMDDPDKMSVEGYDLWAGSHVLGQIDRWKHDAELRDKCYDLLADYKDLDKMLATQINGLLNVQNDSVVRQAQYTAAQMKDLPNLLKQLKEIQEGREHGDEQTPAE